MSRGRIALAFMATLVFSVPATSQSPPKPSAWGARTIMEPIIVAHGGFSAVCNPRAVAVTSRSVDQIDKLVGPTGPQRAALEELRTAVSKASEVHSAACPREIPRGSGERLAFTERRLAALTEALRLVNPAFEAFHATLNDEQKAKLDAGPSRWRWRR
jgi:LTXXQ motif family protein